MKPIITKITDEWIKQNNPCQEALDWWNKDPNTKYEGLGVDKKLILRNCVEPELGLHILNESKREIQPELFK